MTQNQNYSEAIESVSDRALLAGGLVSVVGLLAGDKAMLQAGLTHIAGKMLIKAINCLNLLTSQI